MRERERMKEKKSDRVSERERESMKEKKSDRVSERESMKEKKSNGITSSIGISMSMNLEV